MRRETHDSHLEIARHSPLQLLRRGVDLLRFFGLHGVRLLRRSSCPRGSLGLEESSGGGVDRFGETKNQFGVDVGDVSAALQVNGSSVMTERVD